MSRFVVNRCLVVHPGPTDQCCREEWIGEERQRLRQGCQRTPREHLHGRHGEQQRCHEPDDPERARHGIGGTDERQLSGPQSRTGGERGHARCKFHRRAGDDEGFAGEESEETSRRRVVALAQVMNRQHSARHHESDPVDSPQESAQWRRSECPGDAEHRADHQATRRDQPTIRFALVLRTPRCRVTVGESIRAVAVTVSESIRPLAPSLCLASSPIADARSRGWSHRTGTRCRSRASGSDGNRFGDELLGPASCVDHEEAIHNFSCRTYTLRPDSSNRTHASAAVRADQAEPTKSLDRSGRLMNPLRPGIG